MAGKGLELPSIVYRDGGVEFIIPFIPGKTFNPFPSCTKFIGKGRVKFILNFITGKESCHFTMEKGLNLLSTCRPPNTKLIISPFPSEKLMNSFPSV